MHPVIQWRYRTPKLNGAYYGPNVDLEVETSGYGPSGYFVTCWSPLESFCRTALCYLNINPMFQDCISRDTTVVGKTDDCESSKEQIHSWGHRIHPNRYILIPQAREWASVISKAVYDGVSYTYAIFIIIAKDSVVQHATLKIHTFQINTIIWHNKNHSDYFWTRVYQHWIYIHACINMNSDFVTCNKIDNWTASNRPYICSREWCNGDWLCIQFYDKKI